MEIHVYMYKCRSSPPFCGSIVIIFFETGPSADLISILHVLRKLLANVCFSETVWRERSQFMHTNRLLHA
jgi:hypothetical protein